MRAEEPATLAADYAGLADALDLPDREATDQRVVVEAVRKWLQQNGYWLLVFDNAGEPAAVRGYLPQGATGHVIITSRNPSWGAVANSLSVEVMERTEAIGFLHKRTGQADDEATDKLAAALGDLPLALEQAGSYIEATGGSLSKYLNLFLAHQEKLLSDYGPSTDYRDTVATTWKLSFQQAGEGSPAAADLLNLCAFLAPDDIPRELLSEWSEHLPEPLAEAVVDTLAFDHAVAALRRSSLVEARGDALSVHRLVQAVTRDRLREDAQETWAEAAVRLLDSAFPFESDDVRTWPQCARLLPHALEAARHTEELEVAQEPTGRILNQVGVYLRGRAQFPAARAAFERALKIVEAAFGPDHPNVATTVNNLGLVLQELGDLEGAKSNYERALKIDEAAFGPDHPEVASIVGNLGGLLQALDDLDGAKSAYQRALTIDEAAYGPNHPKVATCVTNLGGLLQLLGDLQGSRSAYERALKIDEAAFGPDHANVARDVNNLGTLLRDLGDLEGAKSNYERALKISEAAYGPNHPEVAIRLSNLGLVLQDLGDLKGAKAAIDRALNIDEAAYGPDHPNVGRDLNNLGIVLRHMGDLKAARAACERALEIDEAAYGPDHPNLARDVNNLGGVLQDLGDLKAARAAYERALEIDEAAYGPDHPRIAIRVNNLGLLLRDLGDLKRARAVIERALKIEEGAYGPDPQHPHFAISLNNLGLGLQDLGDLKGAKAAFERSLMILEQVLPSDHPHIRMVQENLEALERQEGA